LGKNSSRTQTGLKTGRRLPGLVQHVLPADGLSADLARLSPPADRFVRTGKTSPDRTDGTALETGGPSSAASPASHTRAAAGVRDRPPRTLTPSRAPSRPSPPNRTIVATACFDLASLQPMFCKFGPS
jgi:hypothetical protein